MTAGTSVAETSTVRVQARNAPLGADVSGVDLTEPLDSVTVAQLRRGLLDHLVLFFHDQDLSTSQLMEVGQHFAPIDADAPGYTAGSELPPGVSTLKSTSGGPGAGAVDYWHADSTYRRKPPMGALLRAIQVPPRGGDTLFANMYVAYDALSTPMRSMLDQLTAEHSTTPVEQLLRQRSAKAYPYRDNGATFTTHPAVRVHPETERKLLFVNSAYTTRLMELGELESNSLLAFFFEHVKTPEFHCRLTWEPNTIAFWDNRAVQHYGAADYNELRIMTRVSLEGDEPRGIASG
jgi:taurine dioxygenase